MTGTDPRTGTDPSQSVLPNLDDGHVPTGPPLTGPNTTPNRAVDSLLCGVVATLVTTLQLSSIYYSSGSPDLSDSLGDAFVRFRGALIYATTEPTLANPDVAIAAVAAVLAVLAVVLGTLSRRRAGRSRKASVGRWLGVISLIAYGVCAVVLALLPLENHIVLDGVLDSSAHPQQESSFVDSRLAENLRGMALKQDKYLTAHPDKRGVAVTATTPGGTATVITPDDFHAWPGSVIAVQVGPFGYCVSGCNKDATKATSPAASMLYRSGSHGIEAAVGTC